MVDVDGVAERDVETVIAILDGIGEAIAADEELGPMLEATPAYAGTTRFSANGATLRLSGRVRPESRVRIETEMRRRVAAELAAGGIELIRPNWQGPTSA
jgi:hypothetical protein